MPIDEDSKNARLQTIISAIVAVVTTVVGAVVTIQVARMSVAVKAVAATTEETAKTTEKIHIATNSSRTEMLRVLVAQSKRIADVSKDPQDKLAYERAVKDLEAAEQATKSLENGKSDEP
jgi:hypothetical protein